MVIIWIRSIVNAHHEKDYDHNIHLSRERGPSNYATSTGILPLFTECSCSSINDRHVICPDFYLSISVRPQSPPIPVSPLFPPTTCTSLPSFSAPSCIMYIAPLLLRSSLYRVHRSPLSPLLLISCTSHLHHTISVSGHPCRSHALNSLVGEVLSLYLAHHLSHIPMVLHANFGLPNLPQQYQELRVGMDYLKVILYIQNKLIKSTGWTRQIPYFSREVWWITRYKVRTIFIEMTELCTAMIKVTRHAVNHFF